MSELGTISGTLVHGLAAVALAVTGVALVAMVLDPLLRRLPWPRLRAVPWWLVLLRCALPPGIVAPWGLAPGLRLLTGDGAAANPDVMAPVTASVASPLPVDAAPFDATPLAVLWLIGAASLAALCFVRARRARTRLIAGSRPAGADWTAASARAARRLGLRRAPAVRVRPGLPSPLLFGVVRPVVVVPERLPGEDEHPSAVRREHVLLHECAHLRRRDPLLGACATAIQVVFWFHPLVWLARRRLARIVELCTDAEVAAVLRDDTPRYRSTLLAVAATALDPDARGPVPADGWALVAGRASILERLRFLETSALRRGSGGRVASAVLALALMATVLPARAPESTRADPSEESRAGRVAPPEPTAPTTIDGPGCLRLRYAVLAAIAEEVRSGEGETPSP